MTIGLGGLVFAIFLFLKLAGIGASRRGRGGGSRARYGSALPSGPCLWCLLALLQSCSRSGAR